MSPAEVEAPKRRRRWWRRLWWILPLVFLCALAIRVATYPIPVWRLQGDGSAPALPGALHVHSTRSDGRGTPSEIAAAAREAGLRFVVITDHNLAPLPPRYEEGVLVLHGTEMTTRDGHLLAMDYQGEPPPPGTPAQKAMVRIRQAGGFTVVAHGHDPKAPWKRWDLARLTGMEIYNAGADARRNLRFPYGTVLAAALSYPFNPDYALTLLHERPVRALQRFDELARRRRVVGFCGLDAHGLPGYARLFRAQRTYLPGVTLQGEARRDARAVWTALREGRHYCGFSVFADAARFHFAASVGDVHAQPADTLPTGDEIRFAATLGVRTAPNAEIVLYRDGREVQRTRGTRLVHRDRRAGAYRVEVVLPIPNLLGGSHPETWIYSNAIFVRRR